MTEVKATAMATTIAKALGITREKAFDAILAAATELGATGTRFSGKLAGEIEAVVTQNARRGTVATIQRRTIGA